MAEQKKKPDEVAADLSKDALRHVASSRLGRRFLWNLMGKCGLGKNPYTGDNNATNFNCGRLSVATDLLVELDGLESDVYAAMCRESKEDESYVRGEHERKPSGGSGDGSATGESGGGDYDPLAEQ